MFEFVSFQSLFQITGSLLRINKVESNLKTNLKEIWIVHALKKI